MPRRGTGRAAPTPPSAVRRPAHPTLGSAACCVCVCCLPFKSLTGVGCAVALAAGEYLTDALDDLKAVVAADAGNKPARKELTRVKGLLKVYRSTSEAVAAKQKAMGAGLQGAFGESPKSAPPKPGKAGGASPKKEGGEGAGKAQPQSSPARGGGSGGGGSAKKRAKGKKKSKPKGKGKGSPNAAQVLEEAGAPPTRAVLPQTHAPTALNVCGWGQVGVLCARRPRLRTCGSFTLSCRRTLTRCWPRWRKRRGSTRRRCRSAWQTSTAPTQARIPPHPSPALQVYSSGADRLRLAPPLSCACCAQAGCRRRQRVAGWARTWRGWTRRWRS